MNIEQEEARAHKWSKIDARAQDIADSLVGTTRSLSDVATQEEIDDPDLSMALNDLMFECDCCGWWASTDELHNEGEQEYAEMCDDCYEVMNELGEQAGEE